MFAGLTVGDGIVDSIVLEQMTPETLWMVMEFADGTVLETMQSVVPVGDGGCGATVGSSPIGRG